MLDQDIERVLFTEAQLDTHRRDCRRDEPGLRREGAGAHLSVLRGSFRLYGGPDAEDHSALYGGLYVGLLLRRGHQVLRSGADHQDLSDDIEGRDIIVVEDILDSGNTLSYLLEILKARKPASVKLCTLLDKPDRRVKDVYVDYPVSPSPTSLWWAMAWISGEVPQSALHRDPQALCLRRGVKRALRGF